MRHPGGALLPELTRGDKAPQPTCLHGLNAVWLDGNWHRLDPRGNKPATAAPFDPACERLAYAIDPGRGEADYHDIHAEPLPVVLAALKQSATVTELDRNLPADRC